MRSMVEREAQAFKGRFAAVPANASASLSTSLRLVPLPLLGEDSRSYSAAGRR